MAVESSWAGWVLARPLFHRPNLHPCTLNYVESKIVATNCVIPETTQGNSPSGFVLLTTILVHSVAIPSLAATKPKT